MITMANIRQSNKSNNKVNANPRDSTSWIFSDLAVLGLGNWGGAWYSNLLPLLSFSKRLPTKIFSLGNSLAWPGQKRILTLWIISLLYFHFLNIPEHFAVSLNLLTCLPVFLFSINRKKKTEWYVSQIFWVWNCALIYIKDKQHLNISEIFCRQSDINTLTLKLFEKQVIT